MKKVESLKRKQPEVKPPERHVSSDARRQSAEDATRDEPGMLLVGFGKYKDTTYQELVKRDTNYCRWILGQAGDHFKIRRLQHYLKQQLSPKTESALNLPQETSMTEASQAPAGSAPPWVQTLLGLSKFDGISGDLEETALCGLPSETKKSLHSYQRHAIAFGVQRGGRVLLADEMGLGKTVQALGIASFYRREWPTLIVVPASLKLAWKSEISKWLKVSSIQVIRSGADKFHADKDFYIISYDLLQKHPKFQECCGKSFDFIICDESHQLKNWQAQRTCQIIPLLQAAQRAVLISGSPALNNAFELYPQLAALLPGFIPGPSDFGERYCCVESFQGQEKFTGSVRPGELRQLLSLVMLRRGKAEVLSQLPPKTRRTVPLEVPTVASLQWDEGHVEKHEGKGFQSTYARVGMAKAELAADYIQMLVESAQENKVLVFFHHEMVGNIIENKFKHSKIAYVRLDGKTPSGKRDAEVVRFQEQLSVRLALLSITACGLGLTLTAASIIVFAELYSVPKIMEQAEDRAHRIGQTKSVDIHYLVAHGTVDDSILACLAKKHVELQHLLRCEVDEVQTKEPQDKIIPAVRASARPLAQNAAIRKAFEKSKEIQAPIKATRTKTVRSRGLKKLTDQDPSLLKPKGTCTGNTLEKQPLVLSDSEEDKAVAPTMEDSDSDVEVTFDSDSDVQVSFD